MRFILIITGIIQFANNLYLTKYPEICGDYNVSNALTATLVPWICIFAVTCFCLITIPGWLRVFSNTFGSSIASMAGINETISKIFDKAPQNSNQTDSRIIEATNLLYANRNKFMNEVEMDFVKDDTNKITDWPSLYSILSFMKIPIDNKADDIKKLHDMLILKEDAAYFLWLLLIGSITILISTNSLLLSSCNSVEFNM